MTKEEKNVETSYILKNKMYEKKSTAADFERCFFGVFCFGRGKKEETKWLPRGPRPNVPFNNNNCKKRTHKHSSVQMETLDGHWG